MSSEEKKAARKNAIKEIVKRIKEVINKFDETCDEDEEKRLWALGIQFVEELVALTPTRIDDILSKPIIAILKRRFDIV